MKKYGLILASGSGTRFGLEIPKQFIKIAGKTILEHTINIFEKNNLIDEIILVITPEYRNLVKTIILKNNFKKIQKILDGGKTRKESSYIGIKSITEVNSIVLIHDCVRPFLSDKIIYDCIKALNKYDAVDVAINTADTIIEKNFDRTIKLIPNRNFLMRGQTPQCFKTKIIKKAHELSNINNDNNFTDDCGLVLKYKLSKVYIVEGEEKNIKITYPEDIFLADKIFQLNNTPSPDQIDPSKIKGKTVVIFGSSSGIGLSIYNIAKKFGANVFGFSRKNKIDISKPKDIKKALNFVYKKTKKINYIINTAGVLNISKIEDKSYKEISQEISVNYIGSINIAKESIPYLKKNGGGILFFTSSSYTRGRSLYSIYSSCKSAIVNLTQALSEELFDENIKVNAINPERTATPMRFKNFGLEPKESLLDPEEVAIKSIQVVLSTLTGQVVDIKKNIQ